MKKFLLGTCLIVLLLSGCGKEESLLTDEEVYYFQAQEYKNTNLIIEFNELIYGNTSIVINDVNYSVTDGKLAVNYQKGIEVSKDKVNSVIGYYDKENEKVIVYCLTDKGSVYMLKNNELVKLKKLKRISRLVLLDTNIFTPGATEKEQTYFLYAESKGELLNIDNYK